MLIDIYTETGLQCTNGCRVFKRQPAEKLLAAALDFAIAVMVLEIIEQE